MVLEQIVYIDHHFKVEGVLLQTADKNTPGEMTGPTIYNGSIEC